MARRRTIFGSLVGLAMAASISFNVHQITRPVRVEVPVATTALDSAQVAAIFARTRIGADSVAMVAQAVVQAVLEEFAARMDLALAAQRAEASRATLEVARQVAAIREDLAGIEASVRIYVVEGDTVVEVPPDSVRRDGWLHVPRTGVPIWPRGRGESR